MKWHVTTPRACIGGKKGLSMYNLNVCRKVDSGLSLIL